MTKSKRVGPAMTHALGLVNLTGGIARIDLAARVGPHGSLCYGYKTVNRLISTGLVTTGTLPGRRGIALFPASTAVQS